MHQPPFVSDKIYIILNFKSMRFGKCLCPCANKKTVFAMKQNFLCHTDWDRNTEKQREKIIIKLFIRSTVNCLCL